MVPLVQAVADVSATDVTVRAAESPSIAATARFATPAALVAMKLHAYQDRSPAQADKKASDAWDICELLREFDRRGWLAAEIHTAPTVLREAVRNAAHYVLLDGAVRLRQLASAVGGPLAWLTTDEIAFLGERFTRRLEE